MEAGNRVSAFHHRVSDCQNRIVARWRFNLCLIENLDGLPDCVRKIDPDIVDGEGCGTDDIPLTGKPGAAHVRLPAHPHVSRPEKPSVSEVARAGECYLARTALLCA